MKSHATLIRLHKHRVDQRQKDVSRLSALRRDLEFKVGQIEEALIAERAASQASAGGGAVYAAYAEGAALRRAELEAKLEGVDLELRDAHSALAQAFHELKKFELLETLRLADEKRQRDRRDQAAMDEIAIRQASRISQA
ncbi:MAG: hypothetical protein AAGL49_01480 [Pseudomonadota bacterium]